MAHWTTPQRGTWAQAEALVGTVLARFEGVDPVGAADIRRLLELNGLDAPIHTDEDAARAAGYRGIVSPIALLRTWSFPAYREPGEAPDESGAMHPPVAVMSIPAPSGRMFATESSARLIADVHVGDRISATDVLKRVTRKRTRAGDGAFFVVETTYRNQREEVVAIASLTVFRVEDER
jgi:acyl dehydratase